MICIGTIWCIKGTRGIWKATTTIMGPNDARHVVWALGVSFFFLHLFLMLNNIYIYIGTTDVLKVRRGSWKAAVMIMSPNHHLTCPKPPRHVQTAVAPAATTLAPPPLPPWQERDKVSRPACLKLLEVCFFKMFFHDYTNDYLHPWHLQQASNGP